MADERGVNASGVSNNRRESAGGASGSSSSKKKKKSKKKKRRGGSSGEEEEEEGEDEDGGESGRNTETKLLENLLGGKSGVMSAMNHDNIVDGSYGNQVDKISRSEAEKIAKRASQALRSSQQHRMSDDVSVPTWTGRSGMAGAPASVRVKEGLGGGPVKKRFGSVKNLDLLKEAKEFQEGGGEKVKDVREIKGSEAGVMNKQDTGFGGAMTCGVHGQGVAPSGSRDLLARLAALHQPPALHTYNTFRCQLRRAWPSSALILSCFVRRLRERNLEGGSAAALRGNEYAQEDEENWALLMMHELVTFLSEGNATTQGLLDHFSSKVPHSKQEVFRSSLRTVAEQARGNAGVRQWRLKHSFATNDRDSLI